MGSKITPLNGDYPFCSAGVTITWMLVDPNLITTQYMNVFLLYLGGKGNKVVQPQTETWSPTVKFWIL